MIKSPAINCVSDFFPWPDNMNCTFANSSLTLLTQTPTFLIALILIIADMSQKSNKFYVIPHFRIIHIFFAIIYVIAMVPWLYMYIIDKHLK